MTKQFHGVEKVKMNILKKIFGFKNKTSKSNKIDTNYLRDNYQTLINYWGGIIEGEYKLEDGSKFDSWTVYNPNKYLKFKMQELEIACVYVGKSIKKKDKKTYEDFKACYMYFANFNEGINDKKTTQTGDVIDIVQKYDPNNKADQDEMIKEIAQLKDPDPKEKEFQKLLLDAQKAYVKKFEDLTNK